MVPIRRKRIFVAIISVISSPGCELPFAEKEATVYIICPPASTFFPFFITRTQFTAAYAVFSGRKSAVGKAGNTLFCRTFVFGLLLRKIKV
jgi:hypothetical protein